MKLTADRFGDGMIIIGVPLLLYAYWPVVVGVGGFFGAAYATGYIYEKAEKLLSKRK